MSQILQKVLVHLSTLFPVTRNGAHEPRRKVYGTNAMIIQIGNVDHIIRGIQRDAHDKIKGGLGRRAAVAAESFFTGPGHCRNQAGLGVHFSNAVIPAVADVKVAGRCHGAVVHSVKRSR